MSSMKQQGNDPKFRVLMLENEKNRNAFSFSTISLRVSRCHSGRIIKDIFYGGLRFEFAKRKRSSP